MWISRSEYVGLKTEIASLTEKVIALRETVAQCRVLITGLSEAIVAERARANTAVDRMLEQKGMGPVTPVKSPTLEELSDMFEEDESEITSIKAAISEHGAAEVLFGSSK